MLLGCHPVMFAKSGGVNIGIKGHRYLEGSVDSAIKIGLRPTGFGRRRDITIGRRRPIEIDRPKRGDANRGQFILARAALEEINGVVDRFVGPSGREAFFGQDGKNMDQRLLVYLAMLNELSARRLTPTLISVAQLHAPYYRMDY